jgi:actin-binding protein anillin
LVLLHTNYNNLKKLQFLLETVYVKSKQTFHVLLKEEFCVQDGNGNKLRLTPKKLLKQESRMVMPSIHSPAGPSAVRSPAFQMSGYVVFSLRELRRTQFTLNKVSNSVFI